MHVTRIILKNIKGVADLDFTAGDAPVIYVMGPNEAGKSAVLDSFDYVFDGKAAIPADVIHKKRGKGSVHYEMSDGSTITRTIRKSGTADLKYIFPSGVEAGSPQTRMDALTKGVALDPGKLLAMEPKLQRAALIRAAGKAEDLEKIEAKRKDVAEERTVVGRTLKRLEGAIAEAEAIPEDLPDEAPDVAGLRLAHEEAVEKNIERLRMVDRRSAEIQAHDRDAAEVAALKERLAKLEVAVASRTGTIVVMNKALADNPTIDADATRAAMRKVEDIGLAVQAAARTREKIADSASSQAEWNTLTEKISDLDDERGDLLNNLDLGMKGVAINDFGVEIEGIPLHNVATSKRLKFACAVAIKEDPELKLIRFKNGNALDMKSRDFIERLVTETGYHAWIEFVRDTGESGLVLSESLDVPE